jgi:hypothetical protein
MMSNEWEIKARAQAEKAWYHLINYFELLAVIMIKMFSARKNNRENKKIPTLEKNNKIGY